MDGIADHSLSAVGLQAGASSAEVRVAHVRQRVAMVCLVWGAEFADFFARYSIRSLLEPHNIPRLARDHDITLLVYTDEATQERLGRSDSMHALSRFAAVEWLPLGQFPSSERANHWIPWQHAVASRNRDFDCFLVIIPDCVYAAGSLCTIVEALEQHDSVYYRLPQVCKETVVVELDALRAVDGHEFIAFTAPQAVELFIRHVNPKHAAAVCPGDFFINHPEYAIDLAADRMVVSETSAHPLAVRSDARCISYTFDAVSSGARTCYLEILGVSAEPAFKFVEQYYRWPALHRHYSRLINLSGWTSDFRDASVGAYGKSATHVALDQGRALKQFCGRVENPKIKFINSMLDYFAVASRMYWRAACSADGVAAKYVALAMAVPGFRRLLCRLEAGITLLLPTSTSRFEEVVARIERRPDARHLLRRFLLLHVVADRPPLTPKQAVYLAYHHPADDMPQLFTVDHHATGLGGGLWGRPVSASQWVSENAFCVEVDIDYGSLTWAMLGAADRVPDLVLEPGPPVAAAGHSDRLGRVLLLLEGIGGRRIDALMRRARATIAASRVVGSTRYAAKSGAVRIYGRAAKVPVVAHTAWLGRNLYRTARGRPWLSLETAGVEASALRIAKRTGRSVRAGDAPASRGIERPGYATLRRLNIVDNVMKVTLAFYGRLGMDPLQSPVCRGLERIRTNLAEELSTLGEIPASSASERFEIAWCTYESGRRDEALGLFREIIESGPAPAATSDLREREAFVRSVEIVARHAELRGDVNGAAQLYRRILGPSEGGIAARRLLLMLWREGKIREAAELAPRVVLSENNLAQHLHKDDAVSDLSRWFRHEAQHRPDMAMDQDA